jgi:ribosomal protein S12 methylthiotransferase accessory factor
MDLKISFPGGARIDAEYKGFLIRTDQPVKAGGNNTAPAPFDYFIASIGTCAGIYVQNFLTQRGISTEGVEVKLSTVRREGRAGLAEIIVTVGLPASFPSRYREAIRRAVDLCSVKRQILDPPRFTTVIQVKDAAAA